MDTERAKQTEILNLLRNPNTGNTLALENGMLADRETGERFSMRNGIPVILRKEDVFGWNRKQQRGYDLGSYFYDLLYSLSITGFKQWLEELAEIFKVKAGEYVLETSVGTGQQLLNLKRHGVQGDFFGNDISFGMLKKCQKNLKAWGIDAGLVQGNAEALPFGDGLFDVVFHVGGFNFFNDKKAAVDEMIRTAKPGAKLYIVDESREFINPSSLIGRLMPEPEPGVVDPPLEHIPDDMLNVKEQMIFKRKFWLVSFQKPGG